MSKANSVTIVGVGNMGKALGSALLKAGVNLTVWNRTRDRPTVNELINSGAVFEQDLPTALSMSDTSIFCVLDYPTLERLIDNIDHAVLKNRIVINLTNGTPNEARKINTRFHIYGASKYVDGAIMVPPPAIGTPAAFIFCSGEDEKSFAEVSDLIKIMGVPHYLGNDPGVAALYDSALLAAMYGMFGGILTGVALLMKRKPLENGKELPSLTNILSKYTIPLIEETLKSFAHTTQAIDSGNLDDNGGFPMAMLSAGVRNILQTCDEEGVRKNVLEGMGEAMQKVVERYGVDSSMARIPQSLIK